MKELWVTISGIRFRLLQYGLPFSKTSSPKVTPLAQKSVKTLKALDKISCLTVLEVVSVIEDQKVQGRLEIKYINVKNEVILNDSEKEYLHDLYNQLTSKE